MVQISHIIKPNAFCIILNRLKKIQPRIFKTWFMRCRNVLGALERPNDMTSRSWRPSFVLKAIFHLYHGLMGSWWYPLFKSIVENILEPSIMSNISSSLGMGKWYLIVILLISQLSTHILQLPSLFGVNKARRAQGLRLLQMFPRANNSSTCFFSSSCSRGFIRYVGRLDNWDLRIKSMACWIDCSGGSSLDNSSSATSEKSVNSFLISSSIKIGLVSACSFVSFATRAYTIHVSLLSA